MFIWRVFSFLLNTWYFCTFLWGSQNKDAVFVKRFCWLTSISNCLTQAFFTKSLWENIFQIAREEVQETLDIRFLLFIYPVSVVVVFGYWSMVAASEMTMQTPDFDISLYHPYMLYIHGGNTCLLSADLGLLHTTSLFWHTH